MATPTFLQHRTSGPRRSGLVLTLLLSVFLALNLAPIYSPRDTQCWKSSSIAVYRDYRECLAPLVVLAVPTFLQSKTQASDAAAATSHAITPTNAIRSQGGSIGPSTLVLVVSYDGPNSDQVSSVTDTAGNTWQRGTSANDNANAVHGEVWYAFDAVGGVTPTITANMASSVKAKLAFAELDQVAPISPLDGTSTPLDGTQARVDITNSSVRTSSPNSPAPTKVRGQIAVRFGCIAWNDTRTISSTSGWTGLVQLNGTASNLGVGIERKASEVQNVNGAQSRASFTMSASGVVPAAVMSLTFFRAGIQTVVDDAADGTIDNVEGVQTAFANVNPNFVYMSSASAPNGGTGASWKSNAASYQPRFYTKAGVTVGENMNLLFNVSDMFDDGTQQFYQRLHIWKDGELGATVDVNDTNLSANFPVGFDDVIDLGMPPVGWTSVPLTKSAHWNPTGVTNFIITQEGDGMGSSTNNYTNINELSGNVPQYIVLQEDYPVLATTPLRTLMGVGT